MAENLTSSTAVLVPFVNLTQLILVVGKLQLKPDKQRAENEGRKKTQDRVNING